MQCLLTNHPVTNDDQNEWIKKKQGRLQLKKESKRMDS